MKKILLQIRNLFFPKMTKQISDELDRNSLKNIRVISLVTLVFEVGGMLISIPEYDKMELRVLNSVIYCILVSLFVFLFAHLSLKHELNNHAVVTSFSIIVSLMYVVWGMMVSYLHYIEEEQILTFFTVIIAVMCFVVIKPYIMSLIMTTAFVGFWVIMDRFDHCQQINGFNYFTMLIVLVTGEVLLYANVFKRTREKQELKALMEQIKNDYTKQELELSNTRIKLMQTSMKPHFIFNMLGVIKALIWEDRDKAARSINDFSVYLRSNIDAIESDEMIHFDDELKHIKAFVALEATDHSGLDIDYDIEVDNFFLPPLTVEPIVENAIVHGISKNKADKKITVKTREEDDRFVVTVTDNGPGFDVDNVKERVGIKNVRARLEHKCKGTLQLESDQRGTIATITIPKKGGIK